MTKATRAVSRSSSVSSLSSMGADDALSDASQQRDSTPSGSRAPSVPMFSPPSIQPVSHFQAQKLGRTLKTYGRRRTIVAPSDDALLTSPEVTPRKATPKKPPPAKARRPPPSKEPAAKRTKTTSAKEEGADAAPTGKGRGRKRSSAAELPTPEPTQRGRRPDDARSTPTQDNSQAKKAKEDVDIDAPLSSPVAQDSEPPSPDSEPSSESEPESEQESESEPEVMPTRGRRPTAASRRESAASPAPVKGKRAAPQPSTPTSFKAKRPRQSLPAKLPKATEEEGEKEEGALFLEGGTPSKPKAKVKDPKPKRKRASTLAIKKAKSGFLSDDEEGEPSTSQLSNSASKPKPKPKPAKKVPPRKKGDDPTSVFERLAANGSFSSHIPSSQTLVDDGDEDMTLERVLEHAKRSASLSPPPTSPVASATPTPTKARKNLSPKKFVPTTLPEGVEEGSTCLVRQRHNFFVAVLSAFHPASSPSESDRFVVMERGSCKSRAVKRKDIVFLCEDEVATCLLGQYANSDPSSSRATIKDADRDKDFVERVRNILPYLRLILQEAYPPALWRSDLFWTSPANLASAAEYGDLSEDETAEIGDIITEWLGDEKGSERFEQLGNRERRAFVQDVLVPEAVVGMVLASRGEEPWLTTDDGQDPKPPNVEAAPEPTDGDVDPPTNSAAKAPIDAPAAETADGESKEEVTAARTPAPAPAPEGAEANGEAASTAVDAGTPAPTTEGLPEPAAAPEASETTAAKAAGSPTTGDTTTADATDTDAPAADLSDETSPAHAAYAAARAHLTELRSSASEKQWAQRQTEVLRARRDVRAKLGLASELETEADRREKALQERILERGSRGRVRSKVMYKGMA